MKTTNRTKTMDRVFARGLARRMQIKTNHNIGYLDSYGKTDKEVAEIPVVKYFLDLMDRHGVKVYSPFYPVTGMGILVVKAYRLACCELNRDLQ